MQSEIRGKKFYIAVDLEGVACTVGIPGQGLGNDKNYAMACEYAAGEANAAATALLDLGASEVWIWDAHGSGVNLNYRQFNKKCKFVLGSGSRTRFPMIDNTFGGIILIGYHAYDEPDATLAHVYSSTTFQYMKIDSRNVGEADIDAAFAAKAGVPLLVATGDDVFVRQIKESFPSCRTVETKKALGWNCCVSKHPTVVEAEIYEETVKACTNIDKIEPVALKEPFRLEIRYKRIEQAQSCQYKNPDLTPFERPDAYTRRGICRLEDLF